MCSDNRHYSSAAITDLQQIAANIEAERRRKYRAEMVQELRGKLRERLALYRALPVTNSDYVAGLCNGLTVAQLVLDELSPPVREPTAEAGWLPARKIVVCDDSTE